MEDYNANEFRALLEVDMHYMVDAALRDYSGLLSDRCALLDEAGKRDHLESEHRDALKDPALNMLLTQRPFLSIQLDEIAANVLYWNVFAAAPNLDKFFSKVPFLRSVIDGMIVEAKVKYLNSILGGGGLAGGERKKRAKGLSIRTYAFFHFYTSDQHGKSDVLKAAPEYGQRPGSFYNSFREVSNKEKRRDPANVTDLQEAIKLMKAREVDKKMIEKAQSDLDTAEYRPSKK